MGEIIDQFPETRGRPSKDPWDEWLDGNAWKLEPGHDFECTSRGIRQMAITKAHDRQLLIRTAILEGGAVVVQSLGPKQREAA
jgi:hypothetical protein